MESSTPPSGVSTHDSRDTRDAILRVAIEMFGANGYSGTALNEIARAAHVTKGALYHHFRSKQGLFRAVRDAVETATIETSRDAASFQGGPIDLIKAGVSAFLDGAASPHAQRILFVDAPVVLRDSDGTVSNRGIEELEAVLAVAVLEGWVRAVDPHAMAALVSGACQAGARMIAGADDPLTARRSVGNALDVLIEGLTPATR